MPNRKQHIPAFTLMELTVGMLVSAIVIGAAYSVMRISGVQLQDMQASGQTSYRTALLDQLLLSDVAQARMVRKTNEGIVLEMPTAQQEIQYRFTDSEVLRQLPGFTDTFALAIDRVETTFLQEAQWLPNGAVDQVVVYGELDGETIPFVYTKRYAAATLLQLEKEAAL